MGCKVDSCSKFTRNEIHLDMEKHSDQEFLDFLVRSVVDHPDDVRVDRKVDEMGVLLTLKVNPEDMGQIIGRNGGTAKSIRTLLRIVGMRNNARVNLKIDEPEGGRVHHERPRAATSEEVEGIVDDLKL